MDEPFLRANASAFENFWNRENGANQYEMRFPGFGYDLLLRTNDRAVLQAGEMSAARYCLSKPLATPPAIELRVASVPTLPDTPVPFGFPARLQTIGAGDFLFQALTPWAQWFTDLDARRAYAVISPSLAAEPGVVSRNLLDRAVLNLLLREGVGQLHATTLVRGDCALVLVAPHGTGKSTTALHLLTADYKLLGDGLLFVRETTAMSFELLGYPVGEAKLTPESQPLFPEWQGQGDEVSVHNVVKRIVNLRAVAPRKMIDHSVFPKRIVLLLAERTGQAHTTAVRLDAETTLARVLPDTIYWDEPQAMLRSLSVLRRFIQEASCYHLTLGTDRATLVETIAGLG